MDYDFEFENKKVFDMRKFLKQYLIVFGILAFVTYIVYSLSLKAIFSDQDFNVAENVLGAETDSIEVSPQTGNRIIINPNRSRETDEKRLEIANGIVSDYIYLFDNQNHTVIEGEAVPDSNISLFLGDYKTSKRTNPDGFYSFELPEELGQFLVGKIELKDENFQIIKSYSFVFVQKTFLERTYFLDTKNKSVFSISSPYSYLNSINEYQAIDNKMCIFKNSPEEYIADLQNLNSNLMVLPQTLTVDNIAKKEYSIFKISTLSTAYSQTDCENQLKSLDHKVQWHNDTISQILTNAIQSPSLPLSSELN